MTKSGARVAMLLRDGGSRPKIPGRATLANRKEKNPARGKRRRASASERAATAKFSSAVRVLVPLVFASGFSALVFQVAWMRELRLVFGATTAAAAAVLAIFMGGLGIGSAVLGKQADRVRNPQFFYGALEAAIALSVAVSPWLVESASSVYIGLGGQEVLGLAGATAIRIVLAAIVMAVPTFLMGGTLPAAVRAATRPDDAHRRALGVLYGSNTLGAVLGAAAATFFMLERFGTRMTLWTGCAISLLVGMIAMSRARGLVAGRSEREPPRSAHSSPAHDEKLETENEDAASYARPFLIYLAAWVLGFSFFALELVWYRMLAPILGGTTFTFGLILCVALFGIGAGGILFNVVFQRLRPSWPALAVTCGCEALLAIMPYALGDRLALVAAWRAESATNFGQLVSGWTYIACIVVLPAALVSGIQFPLLAALLGQGRRKVSKHLGMLYAWNTLGAICGSLAAGFGAMPLLGALGLWKAIAAMLAALSVGVLFGGSAIQRRSVAVVVGLVIAAIGSMFAPGPTAAWRHGGIGAGRADVAATRPNVVRQWVNQRRRTLEWEADGIESSIGFVGGGDGMSFVIDGKSDGNSLLDAPTQIGLAILGAALHPEPKSALVIGLGTGETAGWLAEMRGVQRVDVVELEPAIDEIASRCRELNWNVLEHPRVRRLYNDGREFVLSTDSKYDVIVSEPSNPYRAGIAALYTTEFYQAARERLNAGGLFIQWLQAYEVDESTVHTVIATARRAFKHVEIWQSLPTDLQLVCSATPIEYSAEGLRERVASDVVKEALAKVWKVDGLEGFLGHFVANSRWADELVANPHVPLNTDDRTILEYRFAKTVGRESPLQIEALRDRLRAAGFHRPKVRDEGLDWNAVELRRQEFNLIFDGQLSAALVTRPEDRAVVEAFKLYRSNNFPEAIAVWPREKLPPSTDIERLVLARCHSVVARSECLDLVAECAERFPIEAAAVRATYYWRIGDVGASARALDEYFSQLSKTPWVMPVIAETAFHRAIDVAKVDRTAGERLYALISQPLASRRFEHIRVPIRFFVAEQLGPERVVDSLAEMEPHVIWTAEILQARAKAYASLNHPLADQAARDWQWFQRHRRAE